jgi:erythronate-4-phosphate dehydrogenase
MYKILIDENIPFAEEAFKEFGTPKLLPGRDINKFTIKDTDILVVRSITRVNESLLNGSSVKFVGTTTIGTDHIDLKYLEDRKIGFANAPGCNADSVAEYVYSGIIKIATEKEIKLKEKTIGIIGCGNIGSRVAVIAKNFGMNTLLNDPPLKRQTGEKYFIPYEEALTADIVTYHVPLIMEGVDKTFHMLSEKQLKNFNNDKLILNTSRGSVVSNSDLKKFLTKNNLNVVLDVWENEPAIDIDLLEHLNFATPHIAGYSYEGKVNGTIMVYEALRKFFNKNGIGWQPILPDVENSILDFPRSESLEKSLNKIITKIYDIENDDINLREIKKQDENERGKYFDQLRKNYPIRREFNNYTIRINKNLKEEINILKALRFNLIVD